MLIESGPAILVTTYGKGRDNIMTISWHMVLDFTPRIALTAGPWNYSFQALMNTKECVLAVPTIDLAEKVVKIGDCSGADTDKFKTFRLTPLPATEVKAPLVSECLACIEYCVTGHLEPPSIFILDRLRAWIDEKRKNMAGMGHSCISDFFICGCFFGMDYFVKILCGGAGNGL